MAAVRRFGLPAALAVAGVALPPLLIRDPFLLHLLVLAGIYAILVSGLNLVMGYSGLLSLGHHAFFGLGAYTSVLSAAAGVPVLAAVALGGLTGAAASRLVGAVLLKLRSAFFVIATIAFAEILRVVSINWVSVTSGPMGVVGVAPLSAGGLVLDTAERAYPFVAALAVLTVLGVRWVVGSRIGVGLVAMRESEYVARSLGIDTARLALYSVVIGSGIAGVAGGLYAHYQQFLSPDVLSFGVMITLVVMVLGGGAGTLWGPVVGAVVFTLGPEFLRAGDQYRLIAYGLLIVLLVRFLPEGVWGLGRRLVTRARGRGRTTPTTAAAAAAPNDRVLAGGGSGRAQP